MRYIFEITIKILKRMNSLWKQLGWKMAYGNGFKCGRKTFFYPGCHIIIEHLGSLRIGNKCFFNHDCSINCLSEIEIGNDCIFGENVRMYDHNHKFNLEDGLFRNQPYTTGKIEIGNNCWFGSNVTILEGVAIGDNVVIGAGTVVVSSVPEKTLLIDKSNIVRRAIE